MLISDGGQTIRLPVGGDKPIRIVGRSSQGVIVFDTAEDEKVVSVERISEPEADEDDLPPEASADGTPETPPNGDGEGESPSEPNGE